MEHLGGALSCRRGDVFWILWEPARGVEQRGRRPGLVLQNDLGNRASRATVVAAISSSPLPRAYPFIVLLEKGEGGLPQASHVNCSQLLTVDQARLVERVGSLSAARMAEVVLALRYELDL